MPEHMMQQYEPEEASLAWPFSEWPFHPLSRHFLPSSGLSVWEEKDNVVVEAALPGIGPGEAELTYERGILTIRGNKKEEKQDKERKYYQKSSSSFVYRLSVPGELDETAEPEAKLTDGVLQVRFKKHHRAAPRKINVKGA
jgi:HSP20 family protein